MGFALFLRSLRIRVESARVATSPISQGNSAPIAAQEQLGAAVAASTVCEGCSQGSYSHLPLPLCDWAFGTLQFGTSAISLTVA